jgi:hypothetical protein
MKGNVMSGTSSHVAPAGVLAGLVFGAGLFTVLLLPAGGAVSDRRVSEFYESSGRRTIVLVLFLVLLAGSWLMAWFFGELRRSLPAGGLTEYAERAAWLGATASVVGGALAVAPAAAQDFGGQDFVGVSQAVLFGQAGLSCLLIGGMYSFALAIVLVSLHAGRTSAVRRWQSVTGMVAGVLLLGSFVAVPAMLLPVWALLTGLWSRTTPSRSVGPTVDASEAVRV